MKWCIIIGHIPSLREFLGQLACQVVKEGDECIIMADSKIAEYTAREYFPKEARFLSRVDWCRRYYREVKENFGGLSWKEFFPDYDRFRLFWTGFDKSVEMTSQHYQFIASVFKEERPDAVIFEPPSGNFSEIAFGLCQKRSIPYLGLILSRLEGKMDIYDLEHTCSKYKKDFQKLSRVSEKEKEFAKAFIKKFINHKQLPSYMKYQNISRSPFNSFAGYWKNSIKTLPAWLKYFFNRGKFKRYDPLSEMQLKHRFAYPFRILKIKLKKMALGNVFGRPKENDKYFLFPLHIQPEASTLVLATYFCDQVNTVKNIAFALPFPYKLYVKEHPAARGDRPKDFYKKLREIPNVVLISPGENVEKLISNSRGVITLTSTIGMEAALAGKPVYVFGKAFYSHHPSCKKIKSFEELKETLEKDLRQRPKVDNLEEINLRFVVSYLRNTIPGDICAKSPNDANDYKLIYKEIKRIFLDGKANFV